MISPRRGGAIPATGEAVDEPIYRAGAWWMRRADGHWIYWNVRSDSWDYHPYGPPAVPVPTSGGRGARTTPPPPPGHTPAPSAPRGYTQGNKAPVPPPPAPPAPSPPWPEASPAPVPPQWPHPGPPGSPPPQQYPPAPYAPIPAKPKPAPAWAAGTPVVASDLPFAIAKELLALEEMGV